MALTRRPTETGLSPFQEMFDRWFRDPVFNAMSAWSNESPAVDVREEGDRYVVEADLPGVKPEDTEVTLEGRTLVIRGRYADDARERQQGEYIVRERRRGAITRVVTLPGQVDTDRVSSTFENGELSVVLPKAAQDRARRIEVRPGGTAGAVGATSADSQGDDGGQRMQGSGQTDPHAKLAGATGGRSGSSGT